MRALIVLGTMLLPAMAEACATCISSPFGDRTYNWPYLILILVPFAAGTVIVTVFMRVTGTTVTVLWRSLMRHVHPAARQEETT
jgi:uncharacterized membrane protein